MPTAQDHWLVALPILLVAAAVTMASVPFSRWLSFKVGAVALPGGRNIHLRPTGRLGGLSLTAGFEVALAIFGRGVTDWVQIEVVVVVVAALLATDDILGLPYWTKLVVQILCSFMVAWAFGIRIGEVTLPGLELRLAWAAIPITVIWLVGMQNSINLLDGVEIGRAHV